MDEFTQRLVVMADSNEAAMDGTMGPVLVLAAEYDVMFGVWHEPDAPDGVTALVIKGANKLRAIATIGGDQLCRITAIRCDCLEQAEALRQFVNTDPLH